MSHYLACLILLLVCVQTASAGCKHHTTCTDCANAGCNWHAGNRKCRETWYCLAATKLEDCPCNKCQAWHLREKADDDWRLTLHAELPCPCKVNYNCLSIDPVDDPSGRNANWTVDWTCNPFNQPCEYHPGAKTCILSTDSDKIGDSRQQCCYDEAGDIIKPPAGAAGTPDREKGPVRHLRADVDPYHWCCIQCDDPATHCPKYHGLNGVRVGNTTHCS